MAVLRASALLADPPFNAIGAAWRIRECSLAVETHEKVITTGESAGDDNVIVFGIQLIQFGVVER